MVLEKRCLPNHLLIDTVRTKEWTTLVKEFENDELVRRNTRLVPVDLSAMGCQHQKVAKKLVMVETYGCMSVENRILVKQPNKWMVWHG